MPDMSDATLPSYLRHQMNARDWKAADLVKASGLSSGVVSRWLSGETRPNVDNARILARALGRPVLEVMVASKILTISEAVQVPTFATTSAPELVSALDSVADEDLVTEVARRIGIVKRGRSSVTAIRAKRPTPLTTLDGPCHRALAEAANQMRAADDPDDPLMRDQ